MSMNFNSLSPISTLTLGAPLSRSILEPRSGSGFMNVLKQLFGVVAKATGLENSGINPEYQSLISKQMQMQEQMQLVSLYSNIIKSEHETQMAAVRNIRVG